MATSLTQGHSPFSRAQTAVPCPRSGRQMAGRRPWRGPLPTPALAATSFAPCRACTALFFYPSPTHPAAQGRHYSSPPTSPQTPTCRRLLPSSSPPSALGPPAACSCPLFPARFSTHSTSVLACSSPMSACWTHPLRRKGIRLPRASQPRLPRAGAPIDFAGKAHEPRPAGAPFL